MYYWKMKPDGAVELHDERRTTGAQACDSWEFLEDTLCGKYNYVTMVKTDLEYVFIWHKLMKDRT